MKTKISHILTLSLAIAVVASWKSVCYGQLAASTFDTNYEGWIVVDRVFNSLEIINTRPVEWENFGPGGYNGHIHATDANGDFYFRAPAKFLGDKSAAYDYPLQFDLYSDLNGTPAPLKYSVILIGGGVTNVVTLPPVTNANTWTHYSVLLQTGSQWTNAATGLPSTAVDMMSCLGALQSLDIAGEFATGVDIGGIDNVAMFGSTPIQDYALNFDGTNDYVSVPDNLSLHLSNKVTLEGWINCRGPNTNAGMQGWIQTVVSKANPNWSAGNYGLYVTPGFLTFSYYSTGTGINSFYTSSNACLTTNKWQHVAATVNFGNYQAALYVDGKIVPGLWVNPPQGSPFITTYPLTIGGGIFFIPPALTITVILTVLSTA